MDMPEGNCGEGWKKWHPKYWQEEVRCYLYLPSNVENTILIRQMLIGALKTFYLVIS